MNKIAKTLLLDLIRLYQKLGRWTRTFVFSGKISEQPFTGWCRFTPTCSQYAYEAIRRYGIVKGVFLAAKRIARCHPWSSGGFDPVPMLERKRRHASLL